MERIFKNITVTCILLISAAACNQAQQEEGAGQAQITTEETTQGTQATGSQQEQTEFITKAASSGMMEVELGKLAQQNGANQQVKEFATTMITDHSKANEELKTLAARKNMTLPDSMSSEHMEHVKELRAKKAADFDRTYMRLMEQAHGEDVELFDNAAQNQQDPGIKAFATKTLPVLRTHHERAREINKILNSNNTDVSTPVEQ